MSTMYHTQINKQTKKMNRIIEDLLQTFTLKE